MDSIKVGCFIAECRKQKGFTQQELATKMNITNKAVSKWETGNGLPDIALLIELADILDVSVDEILKAKRNEKDIAYTNDSAAAKVSSEVPSNTDVVVSLLVHKATDKFKLWAVFSIVISAAGIIIPYFIRKETKGLTGWIFGCWLEICGAGIFYYYRTIMKNQIGDYENVSEAKRKVKEISMPYFRILTIIWGIMLLLLILFYLLK